MPWIRIGHVTIDKHKCTVLLQYIFDPKVLSEINFDFDHLKWFFRKQPITSRFEQFKCNHSRFFASFGIRLHICPQGQPIRCHRLFSCCCSSSHAEYFRLSSVRLSPYSIMTHTGVLDDCIKIVWFTLFCENIWGVIDFTYTGISALFRRFSNFWRTYS